MGKRVVFIANSLDSAYKFHQVLSMVGAEVSAASSQQIKRLLGPGNTIDLVVFEARGTAEERLGEVLSLVESRRCPLLVVTDESCLGRLRLPQNGTCDFVMTDAGNAECEVRVKRLLGVKAANGAETVITVDAMTLNLETYQVTVAGEPVDFTYLEYALLAYLVQHPDHTFSRDVLLQNVWGFDYYGGSRTVDVHVRRIRSKLGPALAQHVETVRGVGYHWSSS